MTKLTKPPGSLFLQPLPLASIEATRLIRLSRHGAGEPHFGRTGANRFDDPSKPKSKRFGTCYCGLSLQVAMAETILHDQMPERGKFAVAYAEFESRKLVRFSGSTLRLANLTGAELKALAGDGSMSTVMPYTLPQLWARAVHRHSDNVDGILFVSRHVNTSKAVVVFDRAARKLGRATYIPLPLVPRALAAAKALHISFEF